MATSKPRLDRRIIRSRNAILSAFERLLMEKPLADITVSAIAREANVDRKTFYVHFGTVDCLLDAIAVDVVEMMSTRSRKRLLLWTVTPASALLARRRPSLKPLMRHCATT